MKAYKHEIVTKDKALPALVLVHESREPFYFDTHWHQSVELSFTISGQIDEFTIDDKSYQTGPGKILLVNSMVPHSIRVRRQKEQVARGLTVTYPYTVISKYFPTIDAFSFDINNTENFDPEQVQAYQVLQNKLGQIAKLYGTTDKLTLSIHLLEVLNLLLKHFLVERGVTSKRPNSVNLTERIQFIKTYIDAHYQADIGLGHIAEICFLSKAHLSRFFKTYMGVSLEVYINMVRARHARDELLQTEQNFTQIAGNCGFSGLRTMNRALVANYGQTARQIKNSKPML